MDGEGEGCGKNPPTEECLTSGKWMPGLGNWFPCAGHGTPRRCGDRHSLLTCQPYLTHSGGNFLVGWTLPIGLNTIPGFSLVHHLAPHCCVLFSLHRVPYGPTARGLVPVIFGFAALKY